MKFHLTAAPYVVNVRSSIIVMMCSVESCRMKSSYYIELTRQGQTRRLLGRTWLKGVSEARLQDFDCKSPNVPAGPPTNVEPKKTTWDSREKCKTSKNCLSVRSGELDVCPSTYYLTLLLIFFQSVCLKLCKMGEFLFKTSLKVFVIPSSCSLF